MTAAVLPHTLKRPPGLVECPLVLDVGAGIRPMTWYAPARHVCVEPFPPYAEVLARHGFEVWPETAEAALSRPDVVADAIYFLDVLEHMTPATGRRVVALAQAVARVQIVVFTPYGFLAQTRDAWGLGGDAWQTHRSGWTPADFPGWRIVPSAAGRAPAFFALWEPTP